MTGNEKHYCRILTIVEEESIIRHVKNANRCLQGLSKVALSKLILETLKIRDHANKKLKGGRGFIKLSKAAKEALSKNKLGRSFWRRWDSVHSDVVRKRQGNVAMNRALNCTTEMAQEHLDELADELIQCGIFKNPTKVEPGVWEGDIDTSRVFNHDETPQFVNYGIDGTANGLIYAGRGDPCLPKLKLS